jgi:hypothetical protein
MPAPPVSSPLISRSQWLCAALLGVVAFAASPAHAQGGSPKPAETPQLPPVTVTGYFLNEERLVGSYKQPEWTTERRFAETRAYVLPPGQIEFEQWWRGTFERDDTEQHRFLTEIEFGFPGRFQLDLYGRFEQETGDKTHYVGEQFEGRWAFADWGKIWGNPTLYLEWKNNHGAVDVLEGKLLLADGMKYGLHWGVNFSYEQQLGAEHEIERALTFGLSKSVYDSKLGLGVEGVFQHVISHGTTSQTGFLLGPSLQWRPTKHTHLDLVPLFGIGGESPRTQVFVVFGAALRPGEKSETVGEPTSSKSR